MTMNNETSSTLPVYIIATLTVSENEEPYLLSALRELVCATKMESGCMEYNLYRDALEEGFFVIHEVGGLKEQVQQSVNFSEHANHETGHSRLRNIVTTWRLNEPSLPD